MSLLLKIQSLWENCHLGSWQWMSQGGVAMRYTASLVQQKGCLTAVVLLGSTVSPKFRLPFWMLPESLRNCVCHRPLLVHPGITPAFPGGSYFFCLPCREVPATMGLSLPSECKIWIFFFFQAFFLMQKHLNLCPILDIFKSLFWNIQLKSGVCES